MMGKYARSSQGKDFFVRGCCGKYCCDQNRVRYGGAFCLDSMLMAMHGAIVGSLAGQWYPHYVSVETSISVSIYTSSISCR